jgi:predicted DNA binding CopG/RHH family protein
LQTPSKGDIIPLERSGVMSPKTKEFTERINVFFKPEQLERIKIEAEKLGISVSAYIRMVVLKALEWE